MTLKLITPPAGEMVTLEQAKAYLRFDSASSDDEIQDMVKAAREFIEGPKGRLNRVFLEQTWKLTLDSFPCGEIMIPLAPVQSIDSVRYYDEDGALQTVNALDYYLDGDNEPPWVLTTGDFRWPSTLKAANAVEITFLAGYPAGAVSESGENAIAKNVPGQAKLAVKALVQHWFNNRGLMGVGTFEELPMSVKRQLQPFRMFV